ncbi:MAG: long-chain fatty acid--CoA ligase [Clostridia bacterium]|nr:long-chain fatty acid--CoA ligase [Clostridia bacterium]
MAVTPRPVQTYTTFKQILGGLEETYGDRDLFREADGSGGIRATSAREFHDMVCGLGATFDTLGLLDGKVGLLCDTSVKWIAAYFAQVCGGGVIVPIDEKLPPADIRSVIEESGVEALVFSPSTADIIREILPLTEVRYFIPTEGEYDNLKVFPFDSLVQAGLEAASAYLKRDTGSRELAAIVFTAGTTGAPKGVKLSRENIAAAASSALSLLEIGDTCLSMLPVHRADALTLGVIMMLCNGTTVCLGGSQKVREAISLFAPETVLLEPRQVEKMRRRILKQGGEDLRSRMRQSAGRLAKGDDRRESMFEDVRSQQGGNLQHILCSGGHLPAEYAQTFDSLGFDFVECYGMTECAPLVSVNLSRDGEYGSIGLPIPCCEIQLADFNDEDGEGEICVKGANVMVGYYQDPEATEAAVRDGWFHTGDLGYMDDRGYLYLTGRKTDLIALSSGHHVHPEDLEGQLAEHPLIEEVIIYSPQEADGSYQRLAAEIYMSETPAAGAAAEVQRGKIQSVIDDLNGRVAPHEQIAEFRLRDKPFAKTTRKAIQRFRRLEQ